MLQIPAEIEILGVFIPPFFVVCALGLFIAVTFASFLNVTGLSRLFWHPPLAFMAIWILASSLVGLTIISP